MLKSKLIPSKIIKFLSISSFCLAILGVSAAYSIPPEDFDNEHSKFIESAIEARKEIIRISAENIAQKNICGYRPQYYDLVTTKNEDGQRVVKCETWMRNWLGPLVSGRSDWHLALSSISGFFVVTDTPNEPLNGLTYTRAGDFSLNGDGYVLNAGGYYLMGWELDENESISPGTDMGKLESLQLIHANPSRLTTELAMQVSLSADTVTTDTYTVKSDDNARTFPIVDGSYISTKGEVYLVSNNNDKFMTHEIALAQFRAPMFLKRSFDNVFQETEKSGRYVLDRANEDGSAEIISNRLEMGYVDVEFERENIKKARNELETFQATWPLIKERATRGHVKM